MSSRNAPPWFLSRWLPRSRRGDPGRAGHRRGEGAATAELVVATPLLLLMLLSVVQFAVWLHATHVAQAGASHALAVARSRGGTTTAGTAEAETVLVQLAGGVLTGPQVDVSATPTRVRVEITGTAEVIVPGLRLPVRAVAAGPTEIWTTP